MAPNAESQINFNEIICPSEDLIPSEEKCNFFEHNLKCVLLGDGAVGKTSLVISYTTNGYPTQYVPTAFDNYTVRVNINGEPIRLQMSDTAGQDEFDHMRPLCYPGTDVILLCFSVVRPTSLCNVRDKWLPEIKKYLPKVPIILVGTQTDLRSNVDVLVDLARFSERPVSEEEASIFANQCGAIRYIECSALTQQNLKQVFDAAIIGATDFKERCERKRKRSWKKRKASEKNQWKAVQVGRKSVTWWRKAFCIG